MPSIRRMRRVELVAHLGLSQLGPDRCLDLGPEVESRHLVLVLVGHQLVEVTRDRLGEPGLAGHRRPLRRRDAAHELDVAARIGHILVGDQLGDADLDQPPQLATGPHGVDQRPRLGPDLRTRGDGARAASLHRPDPPGVDDEQTAHAERLRVHLDLDAVDRDRLLDRRRPDRDRPCLVGRAQQDHVGGHVVAEEGLAPGRARRRTRSRPSGSHDSPRRSGLRGRGTRRRSRPPSRPWEPGSSTRRRWSNPGRARRRFGAAVATSRSNPRYASASATPTLPATSAAVSPIRRCETTGPPFWLRPVWSRPATCLPSRRAAVPRIWFTVTTPVPPIPMRNRLAVRRTRSSGSGSARSTV